MMKRRKQSNRTQKLVILCISVTVQQLIPTDSLSDVNWDQYLTCSHFISSVWFEVTWLIPFKRAVISTIIITSSIMHIHARHHPRHHSHDQPMRCTNSDPSPPWSFPDVVALLLGELWTPGCQPWGQKLVYEQTEHSREAHRNIDVPLIYTTWDAPMRMEKEQKWMKGDTEPLNSGL